MLLRLLREQDAADGPLPEPAVPVGSRPWHQDAGTSARADRPL